MALFSKNNALCATLCTLAGAGSIQRDTKGLAPAAYKECIEFVLVHGCADTSNMPNTLKLLVLCCRNCWHVDDELGPRLFSFLFPQHTPIGEDLP
jgi:hypothetical protein